MVAPGCCFLRETIPMLVRGWRRTQPSRARSASPPIAVNPIYMHPFTAAKFVSSYVQMFGRKVYLNMITGTALNYLEAMKEAVSHDERYNRLGEYIVLMQRLLESTSPVTFNGKYYQVKDLSLLPGVPPGLRPEFLLSGQSDAARQVAAEVGAIGTQMLGPQFERGLNDAKAMNFGVLTRPTTEEAWAVAHETFPEDEEEQMIQELSMQNTDSYGRSGWPSRPGCLTTQLRDTGWDLFAISGRMVPTSSAPTSVWPKSSQR